MDAPERIKAWVWNLDYPSKKNGSAEWNATMFPADQDCHEYIRADLAAPDLAELVEAATAVDDFMRSDKAYERSGYGPKLRAALAKIKEPQHG